MVKVVAIDYRTKIRTMGFEPPLVSLAILLNLNV